MENSKYIELKKMILSELKALEQNLNDARGASKVVELDQQLIGRLSRMDSIRDKEMSKANLGRRTQRKSQLLEVLERLKENDFGFCIDCGEEIDIRRLRINPIVRKCFSCMQD
jgi:DnaK suppressor protein|tara:strand:+ start:1531 stop:1869 length:339 start_codon:yes stop_codon:yes gene_type:complete